MLRRSKTGQDAQQLFADGRAKNMKRLLTTLLCVLLVDGFSLGRNTVFIDPENSGDTQQDGSISHPYDSWSKVSIQYGYTYLQKRGTTDTIERISYDVGSFYLGAYGEGQRPRISATTDRHAISGWRQGNVTIKDLDVNAPNAVSIIYFNGGDGQGSLIENCRLSGAQWGIRITGSGNADHRIIETEIGDIEDDGIFVQWAAGVEIADCHIHHVNQVWEPPWTPQSEAGGDGIQLDNCVSWHVHHNLIDRRDTGNKFCFISNGENQADCILEHNTFLGPMRTSEGGACVYFGSGRDLVVRYNRFEQTGLTGIYHHVTNLKVHGNVFRDVRTGVTSYNDSACEVLHNVFHNVETHVKGDRIVAYNNIFDVLDGSQEAWGNIDVLEEGFNHFSTGPSGADSTTGDPFFVDAGSGDFRLQAGSPCIDTGTDAGLEFDAEGRAIPQGDYPDKGAYEYLDECRAADLDGVGVVNFVDFALLGADWLSGDTNASGNINGRGGVDYQDLLQMARNWLSDCGLLRAYPGDR